MVGGEQERDVSSRISLSEVVTIIRKGQTSFLFFLPSALFHLGHTLFCDLSFSECVSRGSGGGETVGELVPSLLTAPWRKELLILAGDVETNPGPFTLYVGKDLCVILMHISTSSYLLTSKCN